MGCCTMLCILSAVSCKPFCGTHRYALHSEKTTGLVPFAMRRTTRLTIATLHSGDEEGMYMVYNVGDYLHVAPFDSTEKVWQQRQQHLLHCVCHMCLPVTLFTALKSTVAAAASSQAHLFACSVGCIAEMMPVPVPAEQCLPCLL
jgi:hypothetical protein